MGEQEIVRCEVCGAPATQFFGNSGSIPLCDNKLCEGVTINRLNVELGIALADEYLKGAIE